MTDVNGPVHVGHRVVRFDLDAIDRLAEQVPRRRPVSADRLDRLAKTFVPPTGPDYRYALNRLDEPGAVAITGEVGTGRHTAGLMLLHRPGTSTSSFQELAISDDGTLEPDARTVQDGERLLLDLSGLRPAELAAVAAAVATFRAEVEQRAYLVVVLPAAHGEFGWVEFGRVFEIGFPDRRAVLDQHLAAEDIELPNDAWSIPELRTFLQTGRMSDLAELAQLVRAARDWAGRRGSPRDWVVAAVRALAGQSERAKQQVADVAHGRGKTLLLTVAMLHGASLDEVFDCEQQLLTEVKYPKPDAHTLDGEDFTQRLAAVNVAAGDDQRVRFAELGLDSALRTYFWTAMPDLRRAFREWVKRVVRSPAVRGMHKRRLVERFAEQAFTLGGVGHVIDLVQEWTTENRPVNSHYNALADTLLQLGLTHERCARVFRRQFYEWATSPSTPVPLAHLVIVLSEEVIAVTHADQALVRLQHMTKHNDESVRCGALDALVRLATTPRFWRRVMYRLCANRDNGRFTAPDRLLFSRLAALVLSRRSLVDSAQVREQLAFGWHLLLTDPLDSMADLVGQWLDSEDPRLLAILVNAAAPSPRLLGNLYGICRRWSASAWTPSDRHERDVVTTNLRAAMDRALGLHFLEPDTRPEDAGQ